MARLFASLTPARMAIDLGGGWTVASAVAHTGFCDRWEAPFGTSRTLLRAGAPAVVASPSHARGAFSVARASRRR